MKKQCIFFVGVGKLGSQILDLLLRVPGDRRFLVGGRHPEALRQRVNLSFLAAVQLGYTPEVECIPLDLNNIERTAESLAHFRPDLIVCAATLQSSHGMQGLPSSFLEQLARAPMGPRIPLHLTLVYKLMQAVHLAGVQHTTQVLNAILPDIVHPILDKVNLAPTTGIGDLANNIPALRLSLAWKLGVSVDQVEVRLVMARWVSYWMSRQNMGTAPFHLTVLVEGEDWTHRIDHKHVFEMLPLKWKRLGGDPGLLMTATSAAVVFSALVGNQRIITHVPGPHGLPGGYPVQVDARGVKVALPPDLSLEAAKKINEAGLCLDGIEHIDENGTVFFTEEAISIYQTLLGYDCRSLSLGNMEGRAKELQDRYERVKLDKR
ncbi:MAG TPA: hypothetical protein VFV38_12410 [Ktedonobacteraceae bacterium]|nr:hypothetical protein [Ktedonobacteraceae bacterium]